MEQGGEHDGVDPGIAARWAMTREELIALSATMPAATKNSEQKMLRNRAGVNSRCGFLIAKQTFLRQSTDRSQHSSSASRPKVERVTLNALPKGAHLYRLTFRDAKQPMSTCPNSG
jgi:hypothetical protein